MPAEFVEEITFASTLHDIGKVGIPDNILLKRGPLTTEEFDLMKTHTVIGERMLAESSYPGMSMAASIALNHHELDAFVRVASEFDRIFTELCG